MLTVTDISDALPKHLKSAASQDLADKVNLIATDPEVARNIRDNFISYTAVLKEGKFTTEQYLNAVAYVSYKLMGHTNQESYRRTFNKRYTDLVAKGMTEKDISAYVSAYNKTKLVNLVLEQSLVPSWVLNQDHYQKAINVQVELMTDVDVSAKVRTDAANSLLTHLKKPETKQVELSIGLAETDGMKELNSMLSSMAQRQQELIGQGVTTREIAHQPLGKAIPVYQSHHTAPNQHEIIDITPAEPEPKKDASVPIPAGPTPLTSFVPGA